MGSEQGPWGMLKLIHEPINKVLCAHEAAGGLGDLQFPDDALRDQPIVPRLKDTRAIPAMNRGHYFVVLAEGVNDGAGIAAGEGHVGCIRQLFCGMERGVGIVADTEKQNVATGGGQTGIRAALTTGTLGGSVVRRQFDGIRAYGGDCVGGMNTAMTRRVSEHCTRNGTAPRRL